MISDMMYWETLESMASAFLCQNWLGCFTVTAEKEESLKPWFHSMHIPDFAPTVLRDFDIAV